MNAVAQPMVAPDSSRSRLAQRLRRQLRGQVLFDSFSRGRYATDASIYQINPIGVVVPADEADLIATMQLAHELAVPILPRGAGTSQCGQTVGAALVIDCSKHLNQISEFDPAAMTVQVQPGIALDRLNAHLKPHGLWFPVDVSTSAQATLGGMAGNNSCGSRSIAYGNMVHNVVAIDAILADGTQEQFGPFGVNAKRPMASRRTAELVSRLFEIGAREHDEIARMYPTLLRRVGGYNLDVFNPRSERPYTPDGSVNLAHLLVGSEGTLALSRRLHLKLSRLPAHRVLGIVNFSSFYAAMDSAQHIVKLGPTAVELVDRTMIDLSRANPVFRPVIDQALVDVDGKQTQAILLVEFAGDDHQRALQQLAQLTELMADLGLPGSVVQMPQEPAQKALWEVRKAGLNIMMSAKGDGKPVSFIEDCAVPLQHLAEYTAQLTEVFHKHGTRGTWYAHASVGTLHVRPILDMRLQGATQMRAIALEASELVRRYKGAFSGEHGDGLVRSEWVGWQFGPRLNQAFEQIKDLFDPQGLMNPGKIVRASKMDDRSLFRFKPGYQAQTLTTALDWSDWNLSNDPAQGFAKAVEMCNNNGHCRKFDAGTMCPSYRVTRDEQDLTRGRANSLRLALSGQLGANALHSPAMHDTMALCVGCKGCKRDCPTGVDMAKMKIEFLYQYHQKTPRRLRERLVAQLPQYAPWLSRAAPLLNLGARLPGVRILLEKAAGFAAKRSLPRWHATSFLRSHSARSGQSATDQNTTDQNTAAQNTAAQVKQVVLWADTFNNYFEPQNLQAAITVLRAAGYQVHLPQLDAAAKSGRSLCCGRTYLASGDVDRAMIQARQTLAALIPWVNKGVAIVGLEPSCLLSFRDEYLVLKLGDEARKLADAALLFEEFLVREHAEGRLNLSLRAIAAKRVLVHGHCHQKAFDALKPVHQVLGWIPDLQVAAIESSCCGMAGAFGFEQEHFSVSMQMAELSLLPAVRTAGKDDLLVADGVSCRHQILDGSAKQAHHVAIVLAQALA